jgi:hypothetical protein
MSRVSGDYGKMLAQGYPCLFMPYARLGQKSGQISSLAALVEVSRPLARHLQGKAGNQAKFSGCNKKKVYSGCPKVD